MKPIDPFLTRPEKLGLEQVMRCEITTEVIIPLHLFDPINAVEADLWRERTIKETMRSVIIEIDTAIRAARDKYKADCEKLGKVDTDIYPDDEDADA